jgi:potassium-transporting ATPase potassium-binding subunit
MNTFDFIQLALFLFLLTVATPLVGGWIAQVMEGEAHFLSRPFGWLERLVYRCAGVDSAEQMSWKHYAAALIGFNMVGIVLVFAIQMLQGVLPLNPQNFVGVSWHSALNTAVSFVTNTNWQGYSGETTMSYFTQMVALTVQNFVSAATGIAVAIAVARGIARRSSKTIGNFWADLVRSTVYILLPISIVYAVFLIGQGVVQTFAAYVTADTLEGAKQTIALGPAASQVAIKMLGTNGGGFFNANAAHPFENPTGLSNFIQMFSIFLIPAALTFAFGTIVKNRRHGWVIFGTMLALFIGILSLALFAEYSTNPLMGHGALLEGKESRFGVFNSVFFAMITTSASCGAINMLHSSLSPLAGGLAIVNMQIGEVIFGGVGAGLYGMMLFVLMTVFLAGLMVGRTPEYLGKKIEAREMMMVILALLAPSAMILIGSGIAAVVPAGLSSLANGGPHGFSEILYAFTSAAANNGSAFAGLNANTPFYNVMLAIAMFVGRFAVIVPLLAVAGNLAAKKYSPPSPGTFEVDTPLFGVLLIGVILIVGALTFFPALALGPIVEHFLMLRGQAF